MSYGFMIFVPSSQFSHNLHEEGSTVYVCI